MNVKYIYVGFVSLSFFLFRKFTSLDREQGLPIKFFCLIFDGVINKIHYLNVRATGKGFDD